MNVLVVSNFFPPNVVGGAELVANKEVNRLIELGNQVSVITLGDGTFCEGKFSIHYVNEGEIYGDIAIAKLEALRQEQDFDLVLLHNLRGFSTSFISYLREMKCEIRITHHDYFFICEKATCLDSKFEICQGPANPNCSCVNTHGSANLRLRNDLYRLLASEPTRNIAPSNFVSANLEIGLNTKVEYRSNGYPEFHEGNSDSRPHPCRSIKDHQKFIFSGFLGTHKGCQVLLDAIKSLPKKGWCLTVLGDGPYLSKFKTLAFKRRNIHVLGRVSYEEAERYIAESDCMVYPSIWSENEPLGLLQAMQHNKSIIASDFGALKEMLENTPAKLFEKGNAVDLGLKMSNAISEKAGPQSYPNLKSGTDEFINRPTTPRKFSPTTVTVACSGEFDDWNELDKVKFGSLSRNYILLSLKDVDFRKKDFDFLVIVGPNYDAKFLAYAIQSKKVILPNGYLFGPEWMSRKIYRYSSFSELDEILRKLTNEYFANLTPDKPDDRTETRILKTFLGNERFYKVGDQF